MRQGRCTLAVVVRGSNCYRCSGSRAGGNALLSGSLNSGRLVSSHSEEATLKKAIALCDDKPYNNAYNKERACNQRSTACYKHCNSHTKPISLIILSFFVHFFELDYNLLIS